MSQLIPTTSPIYPPSRKRARQEAEPSSPVSRRKVNHGGLQSATSKGLFMRGGSFSSLSLLGADLLGADDNDDSDNEQNGTVFPGDIFQRSGPREAVVSSSTSMPPPPPRKKLSEAAASGDKALLIQLLKSKVDPNETDEQGRTALIAAAEAGQEEIIDFLLNPNEPLLTFRMDDDKIDDEPHHIIILNSTDNYGNTAFMQAAKNKHPRIMQKLLTIMSDNPEDMIKTQNDKGETALILAAANGNVAGVKMILEEDVKRVKKDEYMTYIPSYEIRDRSGKSAMRHARNNNQASCAYLLQEYKKNIDRIW